MLKMNSFQKQLTDAVPVTNLIRETLKKYTVFKDKNSLLERYIPQNVPHRENQLLELTKILAVAIRKERPSNILIFGRPATGKTLVTLKVLQDIKEVADEENIVFRYVYINCRAKKYSDTEYKVILQIAKELGAKVKEKGSSTADIYNAFLKEVDREGITIIVLDEIDNLLNNSGDDILYTLTRSEKMTKYSFIGISNNLRIKENLDPRVQSSLGTVELVFPPYDAIQLKDILYEREKIAFKEGVIGDGILERCAAKATREHGDVRKALELLMVAGDIADNEERSRIEASDLDKAEIAIEKNAIFEVVETLPKQSQLTLFSIINLFKGEAIEASEIYKKNEELSKILNMPIVKARRISDYISELDMLGIIRTNISYKGRYGKAKEISLDLPENMVSKILEILKVQLGI